MLKSYEMGSSGRLQLEMVDEQAVLASTMIR
jgi:hypothetical protein